jgi:hypothetical protein
MFLSRNQLTAAGLALGLGLLNPAWGFGQAATGGNANVRPQAGTNRPTGNPANVPGNAPRTGQFGAQGPQGNVIGNPASPGQAGATGQQGNVIVNPNQPGQPGPQGNVTIDPTQPGQFGPIGPQGNVAGFPDGGANNLPNLANPGTFQGQVIPFGMTDNAFRDAMGRDFFGSPVLLGGVNRPNQPLQNQGATGAANAGPQGMAAAGTGAGARAPLAGRMAMVDFRLPSRDIDLYVDDQKVEPQSNLLRLVFADLNANGPRAYNVRASWVDSGQEVEVTQTLNLQAGDHKSIAFLGSPSSTSARKKADPKGRPEVVPVGGPDQPAPVNENGRLRDKPANGKER